MKAILTYHSIDDLQSPVSVPTRVFNDHVRWFKSGAVRVLPLDEIVNDRSAGDAIAVTFDDGLVSAGPALERLADEGIPATVFIVSGHVGGTNVWNGKPYPGVPTTRLMSWEALASLQARGISIGAHTRTHPDLTTLTPREIDEEFGACVEDMRLRLGIPPTTFAYPYGRLNTAIAERAGQHFALGVTTELRVFRDAELALRLPRLDMFYFRAPGGLEAWGSARFDRRVAWYRARRRLRGR